MASACAQIVKTESASKKRILVTIALLWLASVLLYIQSLGFNFIRYDTYGILLSHPNLYNQDSFLSSLYNIFVSYFPREEPLLIRDVSWALDAWLFGFNNPLGYHLGNLLINAANSALFFLFIFKASKNYRLSLIVSALFSLHPIHIEPVCWVMGRKDLLVTTFMLATLIIQAHMLDCDQPTGKRRLYLASLLTYLLAILSKFSAVTFFLVLGIHRLFYEYLDGRKPPRQGLRWQGSFKRVLLPIVPYLIMSIGLFFWYNNILHQYGVLGNRGPSPFSAVHIANLAKFTPLVLGVYLKHLLIPIQYSISYAWPSVAIETSSFEIVASIVIAICVLALLMYLYKKRKDLFCYGLWFIALLLPYLNIVYIGYWQADRYIYFACFCPMAIVTIAATDWLSRKREGSFSRRLRQAATAVFALYMMALIGQTLYHQRVFRNDHNLWKYEVSRSAPSMLAFQAFAKSLVYMAKDEPDLEKRERLLTQADTAIADGIKHYRSLALVESGDYLTYETGNYSKLYYLKGRAAELRGRNLHVQLGYYKEAYQISPINTLNQRMLARTYFKLAMKEKDLARQEKYARLSLGYYSEYLKFIQDRPLELAESHRALQDYDNFFPFLGDQLGNLERLYFRKKRADADAR
jgi:protein O-mannosyl-transferase